MASGVVGPVLPNIVIYVEDVAKTTAFYAFAFGHTVRRLDHSRKWAEMETGSTILAFTPIHQKETDPHTGKVRLLKGPHERGPVEICFEYADVDAAYRRAVDNGAVAVSAPELKKWGQKVGYVRDLDGNVVRMGSHVRK
ncbi:uncharacterized protein LOC100831759 [Brachypodium distachyon]|uniref:VOC domain-containing protein n=1 Tax=Brachypodium distachyon TaxID=15368 RepID=I1I878_BRADI|nr:uncharacterized protein LOC100831759 [Brachypodium distachyon]KQJ98803.1 hypothetical protein BRADI_3g39230v3 [Brachypodium distachyon]|eukprot:XP_003574698.1 uncharacterized protein LOC100831759 [Brachypodium distachyon]